MIGQTKLLKKLDSYNIDNFPRSVVLSGEKGSGKHLICSHISEHLGLPLLDISKNISDEYIDEIYRTPSPNIYMIDMSLMTEKEQNILLKFIEEPLKNSFVILICENKNLLLNTILNRCITFEMDTYTKDELKPFLSSDDPTEALSILRTPGQLLNNNLKVLPDLLDLCNKIVTKLNVANYDNTLSIANKLNYKDDFNKFEVDIFFDTLIFTLFNNYLSTNNKNILKLYLYTTDSRKQLIDSRLNRELFITNYLSNIWRISREND